MEYEEIKVLKQSGKSTIHLVREKDGTQVYIQKKLKGIHHIYKTLQSCRHPFLPQLYEVNMADDCTTVIEEYIEGQTLGSVELSEKQFMNIVNELCAAIEFIHGKGIIHRDIKPSNIIIAKDGHIRLIDFDAARMTKKDLEQDTRLLGTRGYAPPEQYGFAQTDERADIYALGVTLGQLLGSKAGKSRYRKILSKCTKLDPDKRYQSVGQVRKAFLHTRRKYLYICAAVLSAVIALTAAVYQSRDKQSEDVELIELPAPENPHWNEETGIALWGHVFDSGIIDNEEVYHYRLYRQDTKTPPDIDADTWEFEGDMSANFQLEEAFFSVNLTDFLEKNGFYYFAVCATGDGVHYTDSPYAVSDVFEYTGESAPSLPTPTGLEWRVVRDDGGDKWQYFAIWDNLDDYEDADSFNVCIYDKDGNYIFNNIWTKEVIVSEGYGGIRIRPQVLTKSDEKYRFTVQALTSRPNEYKSSPMPDEPTEEYLSPVFNP